MGRVLAASEAGEHVGREGPGLRVRGERGLDTQAGQVSMWKARCGCLLHGILGFRPVMPGRERLRRPRREPVWRTVTGSWPCRGRRRWRPR